MLRVPTSTLHNMKQQKETVVSLPVEVDLVVNHSIPKDPVLSFQVNTVGREGEIELGKKDWGEQREINKGSGKCMRV